MSMDAQLEFLYQLQCLRESLPDFITTGFALLSDFVATLGPLLLIGVAFWAYEKRAACFVIYTVGFSLVVNSIVKNIVCIYRPWILSDKLHVAPQAEATATGYSFPSGHTMMSTSIYATTAHIAKRRWVTILAFTLMFLTAFSRMWLGCHTPQDVIVGLVLGLASVAFCVWSMRWVDRGKNRDIICLVIGLTVTAIVVAFLAMKPYPLDYAADGTVLVDSAEMIKDGFKSCGIYAGALVGWFIERRFIQFDETGPIKKRVIRCIIGLAILGAVYVATHMLPAFLGSHAIKFIEYFSLIFSAFVIAPAIFKLTKLG